MILKKMISLTLILNVSGVISPVYAQSRRINQSAKLSVTQVVQSPEETVEQRRKRLGLPVGGCAEISAELDLSKVECKDLLKFYEKVNLRLVETRFNLKSAQKVFEKLNIDRCSIEAHDLKSRAMK